MTLRIIFISLTVFACVSCKKDNAKSTHLSRPIYAGQILDNLLYKKIDSVVTAIYKCEAFGPNILACGYIYGHCGIDVTGDNKPDFWFTSGHVSSYSDLGYIFTQAYSSNDSVLKLSMCYRPLKQDERIDNSLEWIEPPAIISSQNKQVRLSYKHSDQREIPNESNDWLNPSYMAIRIINQSDTLFGWIKLHISDYNKIHLYECSAQTRK